MVAIVWGISLKGSAALKTYVVQVLAVLSAFIGANHAREIFQGGPVYFHIFETAVYFMSFFWGLALILTSTRRDKFGRLSN